MEEPSSIQSADSHWLESIKIELAELSPLSSSWTICRVPTKLRNTNKDAYTPHIISVGPIHHEERSLKGMEAHKWRYMLSLLERTQNAVATLDACGKAILRFDNDVRASYAEWINYSNTDLAKMMLLDGCFILELLLRYSNPDPKLQSDPIFTTSWMILTLQRDLALLENQIPFFVLEWLFNFTVRRTANGLATPSLPDLALRFFRSSINNVNEETLGAGGRQNSHHLLHLIHNCYFPSSPRIETKGKRNSNNIEFIHCAAALKEAGIWFEKDDTKSLFDLEFRNGVFRIPPLRVHDSTDALFRNFIAFEQCFQESSQYITSYVLLMDRLIDTAKDVEVLERRRIVANDLGGRDDVAAMFNNICKQIVLRDFYFAGLCEQVNEYYHRRWNRYKASLKRDYCTNPWTIISLLGAFILISLTAVQTVYSVLGYYPH
ncbi:unnamed protein product [Linum tenue]|uniref:Uncharacterized protein n=1 Tax=Linum tenue TaxID=586396 RepID=A0AAV0QYE4_9ROSI|nr:unnamed protein product [Linum tenue]